MVFFYYSLGFVIVLFLLFFSWAIRWFSYFFFDRVRGFECGYLRIVFSGICFSLHFFMVAVTFLIFDVEISLILPVVILLREVSVFVIGGVFIFFSVVVLVGLYGEWLYGCLG